jgi:hypothetical protein
MRRVPVIFFRSGSQARLELGILGAKDQRIAVGDGGKERAAQWVGEQAVQIRMQQPACLKGIAGVDRNHSSAVQVPRTLQAVGPRKLRQVADVDYRGAFRLTAITALTPAMGMPKNGGC